MKLKARDRVLLKSGLRTYREFSKKIVIVESVSKIFNVFFIGSNKKEDPFGYVFKFSEIDKIIKTNKLYKRIL